MSQQISNSDILRVEPNLPHFLGELRVGDIFVRTDNLTGEIVLYTIGPDYQLYQMANSVDSIIDQCPGQLAFYPDNPSILLDASVIENL